MNSLIQQHGEVLEIWTDGATRGNGRWNNIGAHAFILRLGNKYEEFVYVEEDTTNNRQELLAVLNALKRIQKNSHIPIRIYSDSKYVIEGILEWSKQWKQNSWRNSKKHPIKNMDLWVELDIELCRFPNIHFEWVRGHCGNQLNERCDELCNIAMDKLLEKETK